MKTATKEEWKQIGEQSKKVRDELMTLFKMTTGKLPKSSVRLITASTKSLGQFRSVAEDRMLQDGHSYDNNDDLKIFY